MGCCVAYGCTNRPSKKIPGITFHSFPKDEIRRTLWTIAVRRKDWFPSKYSRLCSAHFEENMIDRTSLAVVRLRENAVPTVFEGFHSNLNNAIQKEKKECLRKVTSSKTKNQPSDHLYL